MLKDSPGAAAVNRWVTLGICAALLLSFWRLSLTAVRTKSSTFDEPIHAIGGWTHLHFSDFRNNFEDPPLWQYWASLPVGKDALKVNWNMPSWTGMNASTDSEQWIFATNVLYRTDANNGEAFIQKMRSQMVWIGVGLGALIAWWSWRLGGTIAALAATACFAFDPNFLAHAGLLKNDVSMSLVMLAFAIAIWRVGQKITVPRVLALGLVIGAGLTVKFSAGILVFMAMALLVVRSLMRAPWTALGHPLASLARRLLASALVLVAAGVVSYVCIWAAYGFRFHAASDPSFRINTAFILRQAASTAVQQRHPDQESTLEELQAWTPDAFIRVIQFGLEHELLPEAWLNGLLFVHARSGIRSGYLMGKVSNVGFWYYFPLAMLFKTATATLVAGTVLLAIWASRKIRQRAQTHLIDRWTMWALLVPFAIYFLSAMTTNLNIGFRHVLPLYPFVYVWIGLGAAWVVTRSKRLAQVLGCGMVIALIVETGTSWPNYIAFFNAFVGGSQGGFKLLGDSNLDWGQDLPLLAKWQKQHPNRKLYFSYFGMCDPAAYGIKYTNLPGGYIFGPPPEPPKDPGILAISATNLQGVYIGPNVYKQLRETPPLEVLGETIYLFKYNLP